MQEPEPTDEELTPESRSEIRAIVSRLLQELVGLRGEAVHLEPGPERYRVRVRVGGKLRPSGCPVLAAPIGRLVVQRLKLIAGFRPVPLPVPIQGDVRCSGGLRFVVSTFPLGALRTRWTLTERGDSIPSHVQGDEAAVIQLVDRPTAPEVEALADLLPDPADRLPVEAALAADRGLIVVAGPRASGKRTLLQACLRHLAPGRSVASVVHEHTADLEGVQQVRPFAAIGYDATRALEQAAKLGADAVALCDALHDRGAAELLVGAGLERLALTAVWANDAAGAVTRFLDLADRDEARPEDRGLAPGRVARALRLVVAVRLVPLLCPECKAPSPRMTAGELRRLSPSLAAEVEAGLRLPRLSEPRGCPLCQATGRLGRHLVAEVTPLPGDGTSPVVDPACLRERLAALRRRSLRDAALALALEGRVAVEDALEASS